MKFSDAPAGVGAVKVDPETPVPENVPEFPEPSAGLPPTGAGVAVRDRMSPSHISAADEVITRLLFWRTETVMEAPPPPPGRQLYRLTSTPGIVRKIRHESD